MNLNQLNYLPILLLVLVAFTGTWYYFETKFFKFVKTYWFYRRSLLSYISSFLFILGMGGLILSLLDLRGKETRVKTDVPTDRTIILLDTSASMLAEDVKPSRLQKAILIGKHFARKAVGHQLSVVAFSEIQKKIVPFTNDIDLIDSRLESLKNLRNQNGSSALTLAVQESIQYFLETGGEARGNILVFTDGEETAEGIDLKVPKEVHIAFVGVGTDQGGRIPLDDGRGFRFGYKKDKGRDVITKLNENFFKKITSDIPSSSYWLANSYSLPSEEIMEFFKSEKVKGQDQQDMVIKPVMMEWVVVPSVLLLILSYFFKSLKIFTTIIIFCFYLPLSYSQDEEEVPELKPETILKLNELQRGSLNKIEKLKLADELREQGSKKEALKLFTEELQGKISKDLPPETYFNYGTALLDSGNLPEAISTYKNLEESLPRSPEGDKLREMIQKNLASFFKSEEQKQKDKQDKKDKENKEDKSEENQDQKNNSGNGNQKNQDQKKKPQDGKDKKDGEDEKKDKEKPDKNEDEKDQPPKENEELSEGEKPKPMPPQKIPAKLKQLMSDDRQLQMKMIENGTRELNKRQSRKSKDW